ncbi:MAG: lactose-specific PTS transporter subunit EIIC [Leptotrichiaceae bacterium]|nr:lactose-specific PTS transporter subunit EIIC [Leptotrichiaceae bacterium]
MKGLITQIEKMQPFFQKISRNKYLRAIRDGFIAAMPVVLFSSLFMLIAFVPNIFGFYWPKSVEAAIVKPYIYSMGIVGLLVAGTTAKSLTDAFNRNMESTDQINSISVMLASMAGFLLLAADPLENGFGRGYLGTAGLLSAFVSAFITANIYKFCIGKNITIRMPKEVPPNLSQTFKDVIPFSITVLVLYGVDLFIRNILGYNFAQALIESLKPLFSAADGYIGITVIYGVIALFWFVGIHGPSIVEPAISAIAFINLDANLQALQAGTHASKIITPGLQMFITTMGGTGATLVVPFMFMWLSKSKQNKAIGKASCIPTAFGVNEPILFGGPLVLNPIFFIPFIMTPIVNVWLFKFFVDILGMNSFMYFLPWTTPAPIGLILGTGFDKLSVILTFLLILVDVIIYYPFFKTYDTQIMERERNSFTEEDKTEKNMKKPKNELQENLIPDKQKKVLVLCAGGGTSGLLANALKKGAKEHNIPISAAAGSYGAHYDIMKDYDLIILAPQVASNYEDIKQDTDKLGIKLIKTQGAEYIQLTRDPKGSLDFVMKQFQNS